MDITEIAERWGLESGYFDVQGRRRDADPATLARIVDALVASGAEPVSLEPQAGDPQPAWQGDGRRCWVLAVQLYGVRSKRNWGHGDFTDLAALLNIVADCGGSGVGLNPLHAQFYDVPGCTGSPYSPNSRLFLNPLYIDVEEVEEFERDHAASLENEIEREREAELVDYSAISRLKIAALRAVYGSFCSRGSERRRAHFDAFRSERGRALRCFASFETLRRKYPGGWWDWPEQWRKPTDDALRLLRQSDADEIGFHEYLQWNADRQLARCGDIARRHGLSIGLYMDTAIGVDPGGADAWMDQGILLRGLSVGAPPDQFNPPGQDWGLTAYNPHGLVASGFAPFRQMLRAAMRYAGAVRIDHVLGLMRLYVIPHGLPASQGAYLRLPFTYMLAVVADESRRWKCIVIGEDLGTVPDGFRATLSAWGVWSYLVMLFERNWDGSFRRPDEYPEQAIATLNTHDLPTFAGWLSGHDLTVKRAMEVDPGETEDERHRSRQAMHGSVMERIGEQIEFEHIVAFLATTPTRLVSFAIEDVLGIVDQPNVPGTVTQHPNWRRRWNVTLEDLLTDQRFHRVAAVVGAAGRSSSSDS